MNYLSYYLAIGVAFYFICCIKNIKSFKDADFISVLRGLVFGILLWPFATIYILREK